MSMLSHAGIRRRFSIGRFGARLLYKCASQHARRILYIASLNDQLNYFAKRKAVATDKLNRTLDLAYRERAAMVPDLFRSRVWGDTSLESVLKEEHFLLNPGNPSLEGIAKKIYAISGPWHYAGEASMLKDIRELLSLQLHGSLQAA